MGKYISSVTNLFKDFYLKIFWIMSKAFLYILRSSWYFFFLIFFVWLEFESSSCLQSKCSVTWATPAVHFAVAILEMGVSWTICPDWPWTLTLLIWASQVARIVRMSHRCMAHDFYSFIPLVIIRYESFCVLLNSAC
jgi:hypothetical protein